MNNNKEWTGKVISRTKSKVYNKKSPHYGNTYYRLAIAMDKEKQTKEILAFAESLENKNIWTDIQEANYLDKRYLFICSPLITRYQIVSYRLINWKEL